MQLKLKFASQLQPYAPVYDPPTYAPSASYHPNYDPAIPAQSQVAKFHWQYLKLLVKFLSLQAYLPDHDPSYAPTHHPNYNPNYDPNYNLAQNQVSDMFHLLC